MDIQSIQRMNYPVHTLLLCTPYVSKEDRDLNGLLTEHDFISDFYVESAYDALKVQLENELS